MSDGLPDKREDTTPEDEGTSAPSTSKEKSWKKMPKVLMKYSPTFVSEMESQINSRTHE